MSLTGWPQFSRDKNPCVFDVKIKLILINKGFTRPVITVCIICRSRHDKKLVRGSIICLKGLKYNRGNKNHMITLFCKVKDQVS